MAGRNPKNDSLKKYTGTFAPSRATGDGFNFQKIETIPNPPTYLGLKNGEGLQLYLEAANFLIQAKILNTIKPIFEN